MNRFSVDKDIFVVFGHDIIEAIQNLKIKSSSEAYIGASIKADNGAYNEAYTWAYIELILSSPATIMMNNGAYQQIPSIQ